MRIDGTSYQSMFNGYEGKKFYEGKIDISSKKDEAVSLEISIEGRNALKLKDPSLFGEEIKTIEGNAEHLPEYSGIVSADKAIAAAVQNCSKEEKAFVYQTIRSNLLISNNNGMTEEERQANILLGMKKAEYAAAKFIPEDQRQEFLKGMEAVAKLATAGKADENGNMNYGIAKGRYMGEGSNLVPRTDTIDMMRTMDSKAYGEYEKIKSESSNEDMPLNTLKYMVNWLQGAVKEDPDMVDRYAKKSEQYIENIVQKQEIDTTFADIKIEDKTAFIESLKSFQMNKPGFLVSIINREISSKFWI